MNIYIENHSFHYEIENLVRLFYPNEKLTVSKEIPEIFEEPYIFTSLYENDNNNNITVSARISIDGDVRELSSQVSVTDEGAEKCSEQTMASVLYKLLSEHTGVIQPWGILTGVRPVKLFRRLAAKYGTEKAREYFTERLMVSRKKTDLCALTEGYERRILSMSRPESFSLYISIPFCPTRCSYCSFVSQTIEKARKLIQPYYEFLCKEIRHTAEITREKGLNLESVYIGGGTPTTLSAEQLSGLISVIRESFELSGCREFTVEAGRPDTIDEEKLFAILNGGADRISINPQTLNDNVLRVIGRKHTSDQTIKAYELARKLGFRHINMDLIAGLPSDTPESFADTLDRIIQLAPESITVHTLALKRSSRLNMEGRVVMGGTSPAAQMLDYCEKNLNENLYIPYYLYRQSRMEGNLENVGWSKPGFEGIYNVFVMDETHTIIGCGAGAVTKLKQPGGESLSRIFNYKYPYEYIGGFEEILNRKEQIREFYDELS